jgi:hypothetical protein
VQDLHQLREVIEPWSHLDEPAPEDDMIPEPCAFREVLNFMEMSPDEAKAVYFSQFKEHIDPAFTAAWPVENDLRKFVDVFVPTNWNGINGIEPIEFTWLPDFPAKQKPRARPINQTLWENAKKEFGRLQSYFYRPSDSPVACCIVVAPKGGPPFIRLCGDYTSINKYIASGHPPIPAVRRSIEKIMGHKIFLDLDMTNSFHQFPLGPITSSRLSLQTPWGQVEPMFIPEGVPPASGILQKTMESIFADFEPWMIVIFDNILVLAHDYQDAGKKLRLVLQRCLDRNVVLKFSKSWLGFKEVEFFGYLCSHNSYDLTPKRREAINSWPLPKSTKQAQRFLGSALFFRHFVPQYSNLSADLNEMTHKKFNWDPTSWTKDYASAFDRFKQALVLACKIHYPDYTLPWILRADASDVAVGYVLLQVAKDATTDDIVHQPLVFGSMKFSDAATRWSVYDKEAFAMFWAIKDSEYLLRGKEFIYEGDHANLKWMEYSLNARVIRERIYMQSFLFLFRHIAGKANIVADWQTRFDILTFIAN